MELRRPELVIIAAVAEKDRLIGSGDQLPWHIPEDLKRFKRLTKGHPLIMGRRTFESILAQFGGPLPERRHVVMTRHPERLTHEAAETCNSIETALDAVRDEPLAFIAGGALIYGLFLERVDRLELTIVEGDYEGDTYFPPWKHLVGTLFGLVERDSRKGFHFETYKRIDI